MTVVSVIGAGLAGSEAAWQLAERGVSVRLMEMRPQVTTPAHETGHFAELVCSNSLGSNLESAAGGLLKKELEVMDSFRFRSHEASHGTPFGRSCKRGVCGNPKWCCSDRYWSPHKPCVRRRAAKCNPE